MICMTYDLSEIINFMTITLCVTWRIGNYPTPNEYLYQEKFILVSQLRIKQEILVIKHHSPIYLVKSVSTINVSNTYFITTHLPHTFDMCHIHFCCVEIVLFYLFGLDTLLTHVSHIFVVFNHHSFTHNRICSFSISSHSRSY